MNRIGRNHRNQNVSVPQLAAIAVAVAAFLAAGAPVRACDLCGGDGIVERQEIDGKRYVNKYGAALRAQQLNQPEEDAFTARLGVRNMTGGAVGGIDFHNPVWVPVRLSNGWAAMRGAPRREYCSCAIGRKLARREADARRLEREKVEADRRKTARDRKWAADRAKFQKWMKLAQQGIPAAMNNVGAHYVRGEGVERNLKEALKWYRKAVDKGDEVAMFNLGQCYLNGDGVPKNIEKAVSLFRQSKEKSYKLAAEKLRKWEPKAALERARRLESQGTKAAALRAYLAAKNFDDEEVKKAARKAIMRLSLSPETKTEQNKENAKKLYEWARNYLRNHMSRQAREKMEELVRRFPTTPEGQWAAEKLDGMEEME